MNPQFWLGKRVLVTGHTGFKGSWLCLWLQKLGAIVVGYSLPPNSPESLFELASVGAHMHSVHADILQRETLKQTLDEFRPDVVFHLAAQALVRRSYLHPLETYQVNVLGTIHVLEAVRSCESCRVIVNITSDKCYDNREWVWGYRENDPLGGYDPYSSSKACAELVTSAYRNSYFAGDAARPVGIATARAGNVIGGGDFSTDRLVPDIMTAIRTGKTLHIRNPNAIRPWQHVLESLAGYLLLAERLWYKPAEHSQGWNFGPTSSDIQSVRFIVQRLNEHCDNRISWEIDGSQQPHEAGLLLLDSTKARMLLGWQPRWSLGQTLHAVARWYRAYEKGVEPLRDVTMQQIERYQTNSIGQSSESRDHTAFIEPPS